MRYNSQKKLTLGEMRFKNVAKYKNIKVPKHEQMKKHLHILTEPVFTKSTVLTESCKYKTLQIKKKLKKTETGTLK